MTDKAAIRELREKVEAGRCRLGDVEYAHPEWGLLILSAFDGSLDSALALHKAVLPGWRVYDLMQYVNGQWSIEIERIDGDIAISAVTDKTPARAWLIAILKAMEND